MTITASTNPAVINTQVTYTVTIASTAIPSTTGQIEVTDNGVPIQGCYPIANPVYPGNGAIVGSCTAMYGSPETTIISAVFTGDAVYAQSAGSMTEVVNATAPVVTPPSGGGGSGGSGGSGGGSTPAPAAVIGLTIALASPNYTQSNSNYLSIQYSATASSTSNSSPSATVAGTLTFYSDSVAVCTMSVGGSNSSTAGCAVTLSQYGSHTASVTYSDGQGDTATTGVQNETIEPPAITVDDNWGQTAPTGAPTATVNVIGSTASVTVSDANFEGASSITVKDQLGDQCSATVGTTTATCSLTVTGTPTSLTLSFPGGTSTVGTQAVSPNGSQSVTTAWPAVSSVAVSGGHLQVSVQQATVAWANWAIQQGSSGTSNPPNPINISANHYVHLFASTTGNVVPDNALCDFGVSQANQEPCGYLQFTVTQTSGTTTAVTQINEDSGSSDCSQVGNFSNEAEGGCDFVFTGSGTSYQISVEYVPGVYDSNYSTTQNPIVITVNVS